MAMAKTMVTVSGDGTVKSERLVDMVSDGTLWDMSDDSRDMFLGPVVSLARENGELDQWRQDLKVRTGLRRLPNSIFVSNVHGRNLQRIMDMDVAIISTPTEVLVEALIERAKRTAQAAYVQVPVVCGGCLSELEGKRSLCDRCLCVRYCGRACQKKHWPEHATWCLDP